MEKSFTVMPFMHLVNLPFHEAGHIIFMPFGRFMMFLGGTLAQLLMPIICMSALLMTSRNTFGASASLWWLGQNFMDIAPYINDSRALKLILIGGVTGREVEGHDWENVEAIRPRNCQYFLHYWYYSDDHIIYLGRIYVVLAV
jgi:hypothetical protein